MNEKTLSVIQDALSHAMDTIATLACDNYPHTPFEDKEIGELYYELAFRYVQISEKIKAIRQGQEVA